MTALTIASFEAAAPFRETVARLRAEGRAIAGAWSPIPVDLGSDGRLPIAAIMAIAGACGAALFYLLSWWTAVHAYPFNSGGRPFNSWPTFLIAPVELGALIAGFAGVVTLLVRAQLGRLHDAAFDLDEVGNAAVDRFVIAVHCEIGQDANRLAAMLAEAGAMHSRVIER